MSFPLHTLVGLCQVHTDTDSAICFGYNDHTCTLLSWLVDFCDDPDLFCQFSQGWCPLLLSLPWKCPFFPQLSQVLSLAGHTALLCVGVLPHLEHFCLWAAAVSSVLGLLPLPRLTASTGASCRPCNNGCCCFMASDWRTWAMALLRVSSESSCIFSNRALFHILTTMRSCIISSYKLPYPQCSASV